MHQMQPDSTIGLFSEEWAQSSSQINSLMEKIQYLMLEAEEKRLLFDAHNRENFEILMPLAFCRLLSGIPPPLCVKSSLLM